MTNLWEKYAEVLVDYSVNVQPGELTIIRTDSYQSQPLIKAIYKRVLEKGAYGSAIAVGGTGIALGLGKVFPVFSKKLPSWWKCMGKAAPGAALVGLVAGMIADIFWQVSKD